MKDKVKDIYNENKDFQLYFLKDNKFLLLVMNIIKLNDVEKIILNENEIKIKLKNEKIIHRVFDSKEKIFFKKADKVFITMPDKDLTSAEVNQFL